MTYPWSSGEVLTAADLNATTNKAAGSIIRTTNLSISNTTDTIVTFSSSEFDNDTMWNVSNPTRLTITTAGIYIVSYTLSWASNSTGERIGWVQKNGTSVNRWANLRAAGFAAEAWQTGSALISCVAGDYLQLGCYQSSGGALNLEVNTAKYVRLSAARVSA